MDLLSKLINAGVEEREAKREIAILESEFKDKEKIIAIVEERIKTRKPIQHLIGKAYFMDFVVKVNENVLIPRPETEILVEEATKRLQTFSSKSLILNPQYSALDIGTGSGVISIGLCKLIKNIKVTTIDISEEVIKIAKENASENNVLENITFEKYDLFGDKVKKVFESSSFDLIISNPPYIKDEEMSKLEPEISLHEPKIALCGSKKNTSGLVYYERIFELSKLNKKKEFLIALEIDPPIVDGIKQLLNEHNIKNYEIMKDYGKLERCLFLYLVN